MTFGLFIDISKVAHGSFNTLLVLVFLYQARLGFTIRKRSENGEHRFITIRRHRRLGPFLVVMSLSGYFFGLILVYIDKGRMLEYPLHLVVGSLIVLFVLGQYALSKKIKGRESWWRRPHLVVGMGIVCLYLLQILIGLVVLL